MMRGMKIHHGSATVKTLGRVSVRNVTEEITRLLEGSGIRDGIAVVSVPHTTCGLIVNEDEEGLLEDLRDLAESLLSHMKPAAGFRHDRVDNNAQSHLTSALLGQSITVPVSGGALDLGRWQSVLLIEMDGPRTRTLRAQILGA
jgi:secondary thiamine-phosphate synthase enzyme